jgi:nitric oxide reductase NorD protein
MTATVQFPPDTVRGTRGAAQRLFAFVQQRDGLSAPFHQAFDCLSDLASDDECESWAQAALGLANVNAGPAALRAFCSITVQSAGRIGVKALVDIAHAGAEICRHAGAQAARAVLEARANLAPKLDMLPAGSEVFWWRAWVRLSREAPPCVVALAPHAGSILATCGTEGFENFVAAGLRSAGPHLPQRLVFFKLEDPSARSLLERLSGHLTFTQVRHRMRAYATALWGVAPPIRAADVQTDGQAMRRSSIAGGMVRVPEVFRGVPASEAEILFSATVAHATAHLALGKGRFPIGSLKPLQIVLVGLIEDARIEALAMRRFPGLRRLWAPFHVAVPSGVPAAPVLLARLTRALFDPAYEDEDGFVAKGRALFAEVQQDLENPEHSRHIGGLLGNDLGQMRIQFNAKTYVIEPVYRDDGLGLWDFPSPPDTPPQDAEIHIEAARSEAGESSRTKEQDDEANSEVTGRARAVAASDEGVAVATYPEWDHAAQVERAGWTTVREVPPAIGGADAIELAMAQEKGLRLRIERLVRAAKVGRPKRLRRQPEGMDLDLDALIEAAITLRTGDTPDDRVHRQTMPQTRDLAVSVLIDMSESTRERVPSANTTIIAVEKLAVAILASAMESLGDAFTLSAFASDGRHDVRWVRIKDFAHRFDREAKARLAGLQPGLSTRLGAALRHTGAELKKVKAARKILLALTDGAPSDIDVPDQLDLIEDARRAALWLRPHGIDVFGIVLDPAGQGAGAAIFGRSNHLPVRRIEELPARLSDLYFRVARR